ncbi:hypothetical protein [Litchfieldia alkalitelluris]|uniref:hypothetical protein n=1 Tax=Litchfieldia alkalitelluris TaxID=304268 RepID=UPI001F1A4DF5|nr:hypothetical protein [Litchfieldia alkalitelluris]
MAFWIFWIASMVGAVAIIPYQFKLLIPKIEEQKIKQPHKKVPPYPVLMLITFLQSAILLGVASFVGTLLAPKVGLHWWLVDYFLYRDVIPYNVWGVLALAGIIALTACLFILFLDILFMKKLPKVEVPVPGRTQSVLASFYGGISEEVLMRLFIMTLFVYLLKFITLSEFAV